MQDPQSPWARFRSSEPAAPDEERQEPAGSRWAQFRQEEEPEPSITERGRSFRKRLQEEVTSGRDPFSTGLREGTNVVLPSLGAGAAGAAAAYLRREDGPNPLRGVDDAVAGGLDSVAAAMQGYSERSAEELRPDIEAVEEGGLLGKGARMVGSGLMTTVPALGAGMVAGAAGGLAAGGAMGLGDVFNTATEAGMDPEQAAERSVYLAPIYAGLERAVPGRVVDRMSGKLPIGGLGRAVVGDAVQEGATEAAQSVLAQGATLGTEHFYGVDWKQVWTEALAGGLTGGLLGGGSYLGAPRPQEPAAAPPAPPAGVPTTPNAPVPQPAPVGGEQVAPIPGLPQQDAGIKSPRDPLADDVAVDLGPWAEHPDARKPWGNAPRGSGLLGAPVQPNPFEGQSKAQREAAGIGPAPRQEEEWGEPSGLNNWKYPSRRDPRASDGLEGIRWSQMKTPGGVFFIRHEAGDGRWDVYHPDNDPGTEKRANPNATLKFDDIAGYIDGVLDSSRPEASETGREEPAAEDPRQMSDEELVGEVIAAGERAEAIASTSEREKAQDRVKELEAERARRKAASTRIEPSQPYPGAEEAQAPVADLTPDELIGRVAKSSDAAAWMRKTVDDVIRASETKGDMANTGGQLQQLMSEFRQDLNTVLEELPEAKREETRAAVESLLTTGSGRFMQMSGVRRLRDALGEPGPVVEQGVETQEAAQELNDERMAVTTITRRAADDLGFEEVEGQIGVFSTPIEGIEARITDGGKVELRGTAGAMAELAGTMRSMPKTPHLTSQANRIRSELAALPAAAVVQEGPEGGSAPSVDVPNEVRVQGEQGPEGGSGAPADVPNEVRGLAGPTEPWTPPESPPPPDLLAPSELEAQAADEFEQAMAIRPVKRTSRKLVGKYRADYEKLDDDALVKRYTRILTTSTRNAADAARDTRRRADVAENNYGDKVPGMRQLKGPNNPAGRDTQAQGRLEALRMLMDERGIEWQQIDAESSALDTPAAVHEFNRDLVGRDGLLTKGTPEEIAEAAAETKAEWLTNRDDPVLVERMSLFFDYSQRAGDTDLEAAIVAELGEQYQLFAGPAVEDEPATHRLRLSHNTTPRGLGWALRMGGIPNPSLAVHREDQPFTNFGQATLVGDRKLADPAGEGMEVYDADVYSPRTPSITGKVTAAGRAMVKRLTQATDKGSYSRLAEDLARGTVSSAASYAGYDDVQRLFVEAQGETWPEPVMTAPNSTGFTKHLTLEQAKAIDALGSIPSSMKEELVEELVPKQMEEYAAAGVKDIEGVEAHVRDRWNRFSPLWSKLFLDAQLMARGELAEDPAATREARKKVVEELGGQDAVEAWLEPQLDGLLDEFTFEDRRGRKKPATLENLSAEMNRARDVRGQEKTVTYGPGNARASVAKRLRRMEDYDRYRKELVDADIMSDVQGVQESDRSDLFNDLKEAHQYPRGFDILDDIHRAVSHVGKGSDPLAALRYVGFVGEIEPGVVEAFRRYATSIIEAPTQYLEAKARRPVRLEEFRAVVVPDTVADETVAALEAKGLEVVRYKAGDEEARQRAMDSLAGGREGQMREGMLFEVGPIYHGTPHKFERFSLEAIGTGEGAQAFGWGLYFAEDYKIAKHYRERLAQPRELLIGGEDFETWAGRSHARLIDMEADAKQAIPRPKAGDRKDVLRWMREETAVGRAFYEAERGVSARISTLFRELKAPFIASNKALSRSQILKFRDQVKRQLEELDRIPKDLVLQRPPNFTENEWGGFVLAERDNGLWAIQRFGKAYGFLEQKADGEWTVTRAETGKEVASGTREEVIDKFAVEHAFAEGWQVVSAGTGELVGYMEDQQGETKEDAEALLRARGGVPSHTAAQAFSLLTDPSRAHASSVGSPLVTRPQLEELQGTFEAMADAGVDFDEEPGSLFHVTIRANDDEFIDYDQPINGQPQKVLEALGIADEVRRFGLLHRMDWAVEVDGWLIGEAGESWLLGAPDGTERTVAKEDIRVFQQSGRNDHQYANVLDAGLAADMVDYLRQTDRTFKGLSARDVRLRGERVTQPKEQNELLDRIGDKVLQREAVVQRNEEDWAVIELHQMGEPTTTRIDIRRDKGSGKFEYHARDRDGYVYRASFDTMPAAIDAAKKEIVTRGRRPIPGGGTLAKLAKDRQVAESFRARGIKGIRYRDGNTRHRDGKYRYNYVVMDDALIEVLKVEERYDLFGELIPGEEKQGDLELGGEGAGLTDALSQARATVSRLEGKVERGAATPDEELRYNEALGLIRRQEGKGLSGREIKRADTLEGTDDNLSLFEQPSLFDGVGQPARKLSGAKTPAQHQKLVHGSADAAAQAAQRAERFEAWWQGVDLTVEGRLARVRTPKKKGWVDIRGQQLEVGREAEQLAMLLRFLRNPKNEVMSIVLLDDQGRILSHEAVTSGALDYVQFFKGTKAERAKVAAGDQQAAKDAAMAMIRSWGERAKRMGAARIMLAHNHPSGDPTPSAPDKNFTRAVAGILWNEYRVIVEGQLVINHSHAAWIHRDGNGWADIRLRAVSQGTTAVEAESPWLRAGPALKGKFNATTVLQAAADLTKIPADGGVIVYVNTTATVVAVEPAPLSRVESHGKWMGQRLRELGAAQAFLVAAPGNHKEYFDAAQANRPIDGQSFSDIVSGNPGVATISYGAWGMWGDRNRAGTDRPAIRLREEGPAFGAVGSAGAVQPPPVGTAPAAPGAPNPFASQEGALEAARGVRSPRVMDRVREAFRDVAKAFKQTFEHIDPTESPLMAQLQDVLRYYRAARSTGELRAINQMHEILRGLGNDQNIRLFERLLILPDLLKDIEDGIYTDRTLPYQYEGEEQVRAHLAELEKEAQGNELVTDALARREAINKEVKRQLVEAEMLPESVLEDDRYFHRQVLKYMEAAGFSHMDAQGGDVRLKRKGFQKKRTGSSMDAEAAEKLAELEELDERTEAQEKELGSLRELSRASDANTAYHEAEFEWLSQAHTLLRANELLQEIKAKADRANELKRRAKQMNVDRVNAKLTQAFNDRKAQGITINDAKGQPLEVEDFIDDFWMPWRRDIARSNQQLAKMAHEGKLPVGPKGRWDEVVEGLGMAYEEYLTEKAEDDTGEAKLAFDHPEWFGYLKFLAEQDGAPGSGQARGIFKTIIDREQTIEKMLGDDFIPWRTNTRAGLAALVKLAGEGFVLWQPQQGQHMYTAMTIEEKALEEILKGQRGLTEEDVREAMVVGGPRETWIIPEALAKQLDNWGGREVSAPEHWAQMAQAGWKQWILMNLARILKYNANNMSGDTDIAFAAAPGILRHARQALVDLRALHKGEASKELRAELEEAMARGVIDSGFSGYEVPNISDHLLFQHLMSNDRNVVQKAWQKYWRTARDYTTMRENLLRLSAYRYYRAVFKNSPKAKVYGASKRHEIDAIKDPQARAAKIARELLGDYGNISVAGQWIRRTAIPFWSWLEINAPRYWRLFANLKHDELASPGRLGKAAAKSTVVKGGALTARASMYWLLAAASQALFPWDDDEDEAEAKRAAFNRSRRDIHIPYWKDRDGRIHSVRLEGAFGDALGWVGLDDLPWEVRDMVAGRRSLADVLADAPKAAVDRVAQGFRPDVTQAFEQATGQTLFPTVWKTKGFDGWDTFDLQTNRPIRDRVEHALSPLTPADAVYRMAAGKPSRGEGALGAIRGTVAYTADPEEQAYYEARNLVREFRREKLGEEGGGGRPTERGNALYNYKKALRFGDEDAAQKYLKQYRELGGTTEGMAQSIAMAAPLYGLDAREARAFMAQLSDEDRGIVKLADSWFRTTYGSGRLAGPRSSR